MEFSISALILSAGEGSRLRPLTDVCPKPLLIVGGVPLLKQAVNKVRHAGIKEVIVNVHHHREMVKEFLRNEPDVIIAEEEFLLGTGGAVVNAFHITDSSALLVYNVDVISDIDIKNLVQFHIKEGNPVTVVCVKGDSPDIYVKENRVIEFFPKTGNFFTYAGICIIERKVIKGKKVERMCLVRDILVPYLRNGDISAFLHKGKWCDFGTPAS